MTDTDLIEVSYILEVSGEYKDDLAALLYGPDDRRWDAIYMSGYTEDDVQSVRDALEASTFKGWDVAFVDVPSLSDDDETHVPHFGHGAGHCAGEDFSLGDELDCEQVGEGVVRLFGGNMVLRAAEQAPNPSPRNVLKDFKIMPGVRISISGVGTPSSDEKVAREEIDADEPPESGLPEGWYEGMEESFENYPNTYSSEDGESLVDAADRYYLENDIEPPYTV